MDKQQDWAAKAHLVACMQQGQSWQRAADHAGVQISQSNAYRLWRAFQQHGEMALRDGRHGHPRKLRGEVRTFLEAYCRKTPQTASSAVQIVLQEQFNLNVSISQINRVRILVTTHRGDQHLTIGLPALLTSYEQAADLQCLERVVVDREGMAAELLATLASQGRTVVTVLRTDQYAGLESLREVGEFVPLRVDRQGKVIREVALARFSLPLPEHPGQNLDVRVALVIGDLSRQIPNDQRAEDEDGPRRWDEKPDGTHENWLDANWQATPMPAMPTVPKLIPIVTTAPEADAVELAQTYTRRWPAQENAIRDWLIPLGIDVNHGFAKTPVINSEAANRSSFNYRGRSPGESKELRSNLKGLTTVLSTEIWRRCVQRSPKNSHVYQMDAVFCFVCKAQVFYI